MLLKTRVALVIHCKELRRTTNTGQLALRALTNSKMYLRGVETGRTDLSGLLDHAYQPLLFFPSAHAVELNREFVAKYSKPIQLIVPDGNWRQASKVQTRYPELVSIPRVKISAKNQGLHHLRAETRENGMSTLEAIARALGVIEGAEVERALFDLYQRKLRNTLVGRGRSDIHFVDL